MISRSISRLGDGRSTRIIDGENLRVNGRETKCRLQGHVLNKGRGVTVSLRTGASNPLTHPNSPSTHIHASKCGIYNLQLVRYWPTDQWTDKASYRVACPQPISFERVRLIAIFNSILSPWFGKISLLDRTVFIACSAVMPFLIIRKAQTIVADRDIPYVEWKRGFFSIRPKDVE